MLQTTVRAKQGLGTPIVFTFEAPPDFKRQTILDPDMVGDTGYNYK